MSPRAAFLLGIAVAALVGCGIAYGVLLERRRIPAGRQVVRMVPA